MLDHAKPRLDAPRAVYDARPSRTSEAIDDFDAAAELTGFNDLFGRTADEVIDVVDAAIASVSPKAK